MKTKLFLILLFVFFLFNISYAYRIAVTEDGKKVLLKDDGTWEYIKADKKIKEAKADIKKDTEIKKLKKALAGAPKAKEEKDIIPKVTELKPVKEPKSESQEVKQVIEKVIEKNPEIQKLKQVKEAIEKKPVKQEIKYEEEKKIAAQKAEPVKDKFAIKLRTSPDKIKKSRVKKVLKKYNFYNKSWNKTGNFKNDYKTSTINGHKFVIDNVTGLMWHNSGSENCMTWPEAKSWVKEMNWDKFAGYEDWRLPTLEEASSLIERKKKNHVYIDPLFDNLQRIIWTSDKRSFATAWCVNFEYANVNSFILNNRYYVRPVRSLE